MLNSKSQALCHTIFMKNAAMSPSPFLLCFTGDAVLDYTRELLFSDFVLTPEGYEDFILKLFGNIHGLSKKCKASNIQDVPE